MSLATTVVLEKGKIVRIMGPAKVTVRNGTIKILGVEFPKNSSVVINRFRSYAVKGVEDAELEVILGEGGSIEEPGKGEEVIDEWEAAVDKILEKIPTSVMVVGPVDSGKTTFTTLVANKALSKSLRPAIIDGDVGQCDLAPPGFVSLTALTKPVLWLRELMGEEYRIVGYITPSAAPHKLIKALMELMAEAR
ncbi:MAG: hypothetical protein DRO12_03280, partial [Thermoprotei archaeon]